jgi:hypothetical protein
MEDIFNKEEYAKNLYVIKHKLNDLKRVPGASYFEMEIGPYLLRMWAGRMGDPDEIIQYLAQCQKIDVQLYELERKIDNKVQGMSGISISQHPLFKNYKPIQYNTIETPNGIINMSEGNEMPLNHVCELIRYLYRLSNLTAFM